MFIVTGKMSTYRKLFSYIVLYRLNLYNVKRVLNTYRLCFYLFFSSFNIAIKNNILLKCITIITIILTTVWVYRRTGNEQCIIISHVATKFYQLGIQWWKKWNENKSFENHEQWTYFKEFNTFNALVLKSIIYYFHNIINQ